MRIRPIVPFAVAAVLLSGCGGPGQETAPSVPPLVSVPTTPSQTPSETPSSTPATSKVADTVCVRMDQPLVQTTLGVQSVQIQPKTAAADFGVPVTYDGCELGLGGPVLRVGTSVQPATKATLAAVQKAYKGEPAKAAVVDSAGVSAPGFGASTFVVFLLDGRLYKISGPKATLGKYVVLAEEVARQVDGLPEPEPLITRPECDRGSAAAVKVMGGPPMFRRDGQTPNGELICGWIAADSVLSTSARRTPKAVELMTAIRKTPTAQALPLGDEGYVDTATGRTTIRIGAGQLIDFVPLPARAVNPDTMTQLALAMLSQYR